MQSTIFLDKKWLSFFIKRKDSSNTRISSKRTPCFTISHKNSLRDRMRNSLSIDSTMAIIIRTEKCSINSSISSNLSSKIFGSISSKSGRRSDHKMLPIQNHFYNSNRLSSSFLYHQFLIGIRI